MMAEGGGNTTGTERTRRDRCRTMQFCQQTRSLSVLARVICAVCALVPRSPAVAADQPAALNAQITAPVFPLKPSANRRYLTDQKGVPFLVVGDAPQTIIAKLTLPEVETFLQNRQAYGINALWINLLSNNEPACLTKPASVDGIAPFTVAGNLSTPDPAYFQRADDIVGLAEAQQMVVLLDPIETSCWLDRLRANGTDKALAYGRYVGERYKHRSNIIWLHGNDFSTWRQDDALVQAVARGIQSANPASLQTVELLARPSLDDPSWAPLIQINSVYTYVPTYAQTLAEYNRPDFKPIIMLEASYDFEHIPGTDGGSVQNLRRQEYWTMLSGAAGQMYGSAFSWRLDKGWQSKLDSPGVEQLGYMKRLFAQRRWYDLVPDQSHRLVTAGYDSGSARNAGIMSYLERFTDTEQFLGRMARKLFRDIKRNFSFGSVTTNAYATAAATPDGALAIIYVPSNQTVTIEMSRMTGPACASWFDPTNATYTRVSDSPLDHAGEQPFAPPGLNSTGDGDWVLVLETPSAGGTASNAAAACP